MFLTENLSNTGCVRKPWVIALRIALIYALVGCLWILFSDRLVERLVTSHHEFARIGIIKGWFYVVATAIMLYILVLRQVSNVHRSERSLFENEMLLRMFVEHTPAAVAMFDNDMRYLIASKRWLTDYRLGDQDIIGKTHYEVFPEVPDRWKEIHQRCLAGAIECSDEDPFIRSNGSVDWLRWEIHPWKSPEGGIGGIIMFTEIITDQKLAKEAIAQSEERLANILETVPSGVTMVSAMGVITFANAAAERILGLRRQDIVGKTFENEAWHVETLDGETVPTDELPTIIAMNTGTPAYGVQHVIERPDHSHIIVSINAAPIRDSSGRVIGAVSSITDITEQKRAEEEHRLRDVHDRQVQEEADEAKRKFYRGTIFSITDGKLSLVGYDEIERIIDPRSTEIPVQSAADLSKLREAVEAQSKRLGMSEDRMQSLVIAVGEAAANAVKHAGGGVARVGGREGSVQVSIRDHGPGMDALILPRATLMKGFSTKPSLGLGYLLILESVDSIHLATESGGTWILMEKVIKEPTTDVTIDMLLSRMPDSW